MISTMVVDTKAVFSDVLENHLLTFFPYIKIIGKVSSQTEALSLLKVCQPDLLFLDVSTTSLIVEGNLRQDAFGIEMIFLAGAEGARQENRPLSPLGFLSLPINIQELISAVTFIQSRIQSKRFQLENRRILSQLLRSVPPNNMFSIPTLNGFEFVKLEEIIRCEGLQKYTRLITTEKSDIISSYNIGHFCDLLKEYGFFSTHRSHLVNLRYIKRFQSEGTLTMSDGSLVPVSRRRKTAFIEQVALFQKNR
ncbi:MAG: LytTR family DNA-binding domain-containing protein [Bacteroidota bacterium]